LAKKYGAELENVEESNPKHPHSVLIIQEINRKNNDFFLENMSLR